MRASEFWAVARRPRWIAALLLALAIAAAFAGLGQWQLERSVSSGAAPPEIDTETAVPLTAVAEPQEPATAEQLGRIVEVPGALVPGDFTVLSGRLQDGVAGSWLVGHLLVDEAGAEPASLAVALGWAPTAEEAEAVGSDLDASGRVVLTGRYLPSEAPSDSDAEAGERRALAVGELINLWPEVGAAYGGYLVSGAAPDGLVTIDAPPPSAETSVNWLNIFYAIEWVIFAGFAIYLWYRLVRDAVEAEQEDAAGRAAGPETAKVD